MFGNLPVPNVVKELNPANVLNTAAHGVEAAAANKLRDVANKISNKNIVNDPFQ